MSDTDSFIDEVNDEVRRDKLYRLMRRYGWIAVVAILLIVGGAAWTEYQKSRERAEAEALGDAMLAALRADDPATRAEALDNVTPSDGSSAAVLALLRAAEQAAAGEEDAAAQTLDAVALSPDISEIYREIARFKAVTLRGADAPVEERRQTLEALAQPGGPLRLLAIEQLALVDIDEGDAEAAITRYRSILDDADLTPDLQQRALQVIVALGGDPDTDADAAATASDDPAPEPTE